MHTCHHQGFHAFRSSLHRRFHQCCKSKHIPLLNVKPREIVQQIVCNGYVPLKKKKKKEEERKKEEEGEEEEEKIHQRIKSQSQGQTKN